MKKKAVVFGGGGFLGHYMIECLLEEGYRVVSFGLQSHPTLNPQLSIVGDILDAKLVSDAVRGASLVFNYAAISDIEECIENPAMAVSVNIVGNINVLEACVENNVERYVFASSVYAESDLGGIYSSTKKACESLIKDYHKYYGLDYSILRYGTVYGPGGGDNNSVYRFIKSALEEGEITYQGTGEERREYIHAADAAKLSLLALSEEYKNSTVILTGHKSLKVKSLFSMIKEILNDDTVKTRFTCEKDKKLLKSHYKTTPYSYNRETPRKLVGVEYIDIGTGLLQCIKEQDNERNK